VARKKSIATILEDAAKEPAVRVVAASAAVAGGAVAGKLFHDGVDRAHRHKARRYRLAPDQSAAPELKRVVAGQLDNALDFLSADGAAASGEAIHDARKALKRGRAALRLSRHLLGRKRYRRENRALRDAGRKLSTLRDSQVLVETLDGLAPPGTFATFRDVLAAGVAKDGRGGEASGDSVESALAEIEHARSRVGAWPLSTSGDPEALRQGFEQVYRRGRRALRAARRDPSVENLHELRKRGKDLWHAAQLLDGRRTERARALTRRARRLSDLLGEEHDLAILNERVRSDPLVLGSEERELLESLVRRRRKQLRRQAMACATRLYRRKPRKQSIRLALA
jgi:CHAD domain-containing protein